MKVTTIFGLGSHQDVKQAIEVGSRPSGVCLHVYRALFSRVPVKVAASRRKVASKAARSRRCGRDLRRRKRAITETCRRVMKFGKYHERLCGWFTAVVPRKPCSLLGWSCLSASDVWLLRCQPSGFETSHTLGDVAHRRCASYAEISWWPTGRVVLASRSSAVREVDCQRARSTARAGRVGRNAERNRHAKRQTVSGGESQSSCRRRSRRPGRVYSRLSSARAISGDVITAFNLGDAAMKAPKERQKAKAASATSQNKTKAGRCAMPCSATRMKKVKRNMFKARNPRASHAVRNTTGEKYQARRMPGSGRDRAATAHETSRRIVNLVRVGSDEAQA